MLKDYLSNSLPVANMEKAPEFFEEYIAIQYKKMLG